MIRTSTTEEDGYGEESIQREPIHSVASSLRLVRFQRTPSTVAASKGTPFDQRPPSTPIEVQQMTVIMIGRIPWYRTPMNSSASPATSSPATSLQRPPQRPPRWPLAVILLLLGGSVAHPVAAADIDFNDTIRPILSDRCFPCHGPDAAARKARLRLDRREDALAPRPDGAAIVPGDPAASLILERLHLDDPQDRMPPPSSKLEISSEEIASIERWIAEGAHYQQHWSFLPPVAAAIPEVQDPQWPAGTIDHFILAKLESKGLRPAAAAQRETLARRAAFILTGVAADLDALDRHLADRSTDAWSHWIDFLLASPAFGEQMASHWLDVARYADSHGYQSDVHRSTWPWRDWVIKAFNDNLPHDQFITWQVAGDLLEDATQEQILATTFQRLHRQTNEGGSVEEEFRAEYVADRTQTFASAFLGLTLECARCHDHKFDPLKQQEFYSLSAFFDNIDESGLYSHFTSAVPTPALALVDEKARSQIDELSRKVEESETHLKQLERSRREEFASWQQGQQGSDPSPSITDVVAAYCFDEIVEGKCENQINPELPATAHAALSLMDGIQGKAIRLTGDDALGFGAIGAYSRSDPFSISLWIRPEETTERAVILHRSRAWTDAASQGYQLLLEQGRLSAALIHFWPGDAIAVSSREQIEPGRWTHIVFSYDGSSRAAGIDLYIDGQLAPKELVRDHLRSPITGGGPYFAIGERFRDRGFKDGGVDQMQLVGRSISAAEVRKLYLAGKDPDAVPQFEEEELYRWWLLAMDEVTRTARDQLASARKALHHFTDRHPKIMVMEEMATARPTYLLERGRYDSPGIEVSPDVPAILPPLPDGAARNRLTLARWLVSEGHPLTARVAVNRLWQIAFGQGIVPTSGDFGSQGTRPSHPQLLDHLATEFIGEGWNLKATLKKMLLSATWRQSSAVDPRSKSIDPDNRLLARGPSLRMSAEMIRDQMLQSSGLLVTTIGGPPVLPYQPPGLWQEKSGHTYTPSKGDGLYRRSLYTFWKRTSPPPTMMIFDASKRDVCVTFRHRTSTPMQSLVLMNDPQFVEAARMLARRVMLDDRKEPTGTIELAFRRLTGRRPSAPELEILQQLHQQLLFEFQEDPQVATVWLQVGDSPLDPSIDPIEWAALTAVCSSLMNLDETTRLR
ncbi:MAG: DUF1553 domain-containing protein [Planctomycetes bacterium]|jgi:mono/diheme cytochrome c family protein|nr:DUF1553 domain-containing protein [Planctomycetota bacterium]